MKSREKLKLSVLMRLAVVGTLFGVDITNQECASEVTSNGIPVLWPNSHNGSWTVSEPQCFGSNGDQISRYCNGSYWTPSSKEIPPCMTVTQQFDPDCCPPGYFKISNISTDYCFQIGEPAAWDYPCFTSGGASVITDLNDTELDSLMVALKSKKFDQYWLPGRRQKHFNPATWVIPGTNWGQTVIPNRGLVLQESIFSNCLYLEVNARRLKTGSCDKSYPSLCLFLNKANIPAKCPSGYHSFRFMPEKESCFGIEHSSAILGNTFNDFVTNRCPKPMESSTITGNIERFIFLKLAELTGLADNEWCWFQSSFYSNGTHVTREEETSSNPYVTTEVVIASLQGMINNLGTMGLMNVKSRLPCMVCERNITYENTHLTFEYNDVDQNIYLTVYYPLGLWKNRVTDKGIQCFSNDRGFVRVVEIEEAPLFEVIYDSTKSLDNFEGNEDLITKIVYKIEPVTDRSAQYWCEGHSKNFTFLQTSKIVVNPRGEEEHVFALVIKVSSEFYSEDDNFFNMHQLQANISNVLDVNQVLVMDILDIDSEFITILLHVHVYLDYNDVDDLETSFIIVDTYKNIITKAENGFPNFGIKFVNMSSSTRCLPNTTYDIFVLDWEMTSLGQITAPKQFCLQENGLPVTRRCGGSYLIGAVWREVDGTCNKNYAASNTTTFLYNVAKGQVSHNSTAYFLTKGLGTVLDDLDIIIPADIYYLSMSFQYILKIADFNISYIEVGDINNIAWIMNQVMVLDWDYLRLAQTLNSTNVIVDSINNIIEKIAITKTESLNNNNAKNYKEIAVEPNFVVQVTYPAYNNITGLALMKYSNSNNFTDMTITSLHSKTELSDVLLMENLEIAAWVPDEVIKTLKENKNKSESGAISKLAVTPEDVHIVLSIFSNDAVFQEIDYMPHDINGHIVGISIPGFISNLEYPVTIVFKELYKGNKSKSCGYWDFNSNANGSSPGFWASNGCFLADYVDNFTICHCFHLTHFGQLISKEGRIGDDEINSLHDRALNVITLVGCFLSLLGIAGIWTTAIVFHSWRQKPGSKVLLQLSGAIALPLLLILLFNLDLGLFEVYHDNYQIKKNKKGACIFLGATLHFSILAGFTWMLITAVLQFIRYVRVLGVHRPNRFMFKLAVVGWGVPLLPVIITLLIDKNNYIPAATPADSISVVPICYPTGIFFYMGVILPIGSVLIINVVLFILVLYSISRGPDGKFRSADTDLICAQLRLSIFLFFLLGLTWTFGIFSFGENGTILSYLFCLTSTLQGFVLFIYFVVCDPATRLLWISLMKPQFRMSVTSLTTTN